MNFIVWNCNGTASREFLRTSKEVLKKYKPDLVGLVETKISGFKADQVCRKLGLDSWSRVKAVGYSGAICVLWKDSIKVEVLRTHPQFIHLEVQVHGDDPWLLPIVYGSPTFTLQKFLWQSLHLNNLDLSKAWIAVGDFNAIVSAYEMSSSGNMDSRRCSDFTSWISQHQLIDLGFSGSRFTWTRCLSTDTFKGARLDRALCNSFWKCRFDRAVVTHLPKLSYDGLLSFFNWLVIIFFPRGQGLNSKLLG